ncbi:MAG: hypothetical protein FJY98_03085 [Candidatus Liptonbacteria bacterium]|nr:hypothetical protein [Candidatus Liptonbacteria bacterium]
MQILPSINCADVECAREHIGALQGNSLWLHLDIADARFTFNKTWGDPLSWPIFGKGFNLEVHLMVEEPEEVVEAWLQAGAKQVVVHVEALEDTRFRKRTEDPLSLAYAIKDACAAKGAEVVLGINSETSPEHLSPYLGFIRKFLVLSVHPGLAGQKFLPAALRTIEWIKREAPHATIEVDGGITPEVAKKVKAAGADVLIAASFIFKEKDIKKAIEALQNV